jgi:hypothetical protein
VAAAADPAAQAPPSAASSADDETPVAPVPPASVPVAYLDPGASWASTVAARPGTRLEAAVIGRVRLRYDETSIDVVHDEEYEAVLHPLPAGADVTGLRQVDYDDRDLLPAGPDGATYVLPAAAVTTARWWTDLQRALSDHLVRSRTLEVLTNPELKLWSRPGETADAFAERCRAAADQAADAATAALTRKAEARVRALRSRVDAAAGQAQAAEQARNARVGTEVASTVGSMLGGLFGGRRSRTSVAAAAGRAQSAQSRVDTARARADDLAGQLADLESDLAADVAALDDEWRAKAEAVQPVAVPLEKTDVAVAELRLVWIPLG